MLSIDELFDATRENPWIGKFAEGWILDQDTGGGDEKVANTELNLLFAEGAADEWLAAIIAIARRTEDGRHDASLAAGLLEDFLVRHGDMYIDLIAELAQKWPRLRHLLGGVWQNEMKRGVWHRIEAIRGKQW